MPNFSNFFLLLLIFFTFKTHSLTHPSDISALKSFKSSIKPTTIPSFSCLASWNFTTDPCSTPHINHFTCGLTCSNSVPARVTQITLDPAGYSGTLTPLISGLTQLTLLDLSDNKFYGSIPPSLSSLQNLNTLILRTNSFSGEVPSLTRLNSLESVDFSQNSLTSISLNTFSALTKLRRLDLSFNKLTGPIPNLPPNLIELAIKGNSLSGSLSKSSFTELTQLEVVELGENSLSGTLPAWLFLLPSLQQINLANNSFTRVEIWKPVNKNSDLIAVDLGFNKIQGYVPVNFADYPRLSSLNLRYNRLRGPVPWEYSKKETLKRLYLDGNYLNGSPAKGFFSGESAVSGSLGDNCLQACPVSSDLCLKSQKSTSICRQAYSGKPRL